MRCPSCGAEASGKYCANCGASLAKEKCRGCDRPLGPGIRFCPHCGEAVGVPSRTGENVAWYVAGAAMLVLIIILALNLFGDRTPEPLVAPGMPLGTPGPFEGTMREQADRLFNRIMTQLAAGDSTQALFFVPMALEAYEAARPLDDDGLYHLAILYNAAGDPARGREVAGEILAGNPDHLLGLAAAGEAALLQGDSAAARSHYERFLQAYPTESVRPLPEYVDHAAILPQYRETAARVAGR
jgi:tetratricopeptide (TPR) repeat protein